MQTQVDSPVGYFRFSQKVGLVLVLACLTWMTPFCHAQTPAPAKAPNKDVPYITVENHAWGPAGELVLCVRVHAPLTKGFSLGGKSNGSFSLLESSLLNVNTNEKSSPLPLLKKPFFGPCEVASDMGPNDWVEMGVVFPKPADPAKDAAGKPQNYQFKFIPPLKMEPVLVEIPVPVAPTTAAAP